MSYFFEGFLLQASLILALGAQNIFVLESGLKKNRHLMVATICSVCDAFLICIGVLGAASIFIKIPILKIIFGIVGIIFLAIYGVKKLRLSFFKNQSMAEEQIKINNKKEVIMLSLGFSLLNPHVYLDTVILIGGYSAKYTEVLPRALFGSGAAFFSVIWFYGLALFASVMSAILNQPKAMRLIAFISGIILIFLAMKLSMNVLNWI